MFTPEQEIHWWAERYRFCRTWKHERKPIYGELMRVAYRNLLVAEFTFLFNHRLKQRGGCL